jgi:hypothetical protein
MKWLNASKVLPENNEEVLLRSGGKFLLVTFDGKHKVFKARKGALYDPKDRELLWCRLIPPEKK